MTEAEWLACDEPLPMLEFLRGKASDRKLRLFVADAARSLASIFGKEQQAIAEMHERVADGEATEEDLERFLGRDMPRLWEHRAPGGNLPDIWTSARTAARERFKLAPLAGSEIVLTDARIAENADMCGVLRCIFGPTAGPVPLAPVWLAWNGGTLAKLARAIYEERAFTHLPILADALEDAGCADDAILSHLRSPGRHVRGCWALDLVLGKE